MKQSAKAITLTGLAGAAAFAGSTQAYGAVVNLTLPTNIPGHAPSTAGTTREYYNVQTGLTTTTTAANPGYDLNLGYFNGSATAPNEFFTGIYVNGGGGLVSYYAGNATNYAYGLPAGTTVGTGGTYATFGQKAGYYSILALTYNGIAYAIMKPNISYYLGFQFTASDGLLHDGWLQLESDSYVSAANPGGFKFLAGAYNTTPDNAGGRVTVGVGAVPEPGTLAALAMGASVLTGLGFKRRRAARAAALTA